VVKVTVRPARNDKAQIPYGTARGQRPLQIVILKQLTANIERCFYLSQDNFRSPTLKKVGDIIIFLSLANNKYIIKTIYNSDCDLSKSEVTILPLGCR